MEGHTSQHLSSPSLASVLAERVRLITLPEAQTIGVPSFQKLAVDGEAESSREPYGTRPAFTILKGNTQPMF
ncbi:hypothetical protein AAMO2058_001546600 [Amorphochlora amoebiformis]